MNRLPFLLLVLVSLSYASLIYTVDTDRSGSSSIILSLEGENSANVSLPADAANFRVVGGSYEVINDSAVVSSGASGITTFSFSTSSLATKTADGWKLSVSPSSGSRVQVYMPAFAVIRDSVPQPARVSSEDSRTLLEFGYADLISVEYRLEEPLAQPADSSDVYLLAAAIVIALGVVIASFVLRSNPKQKAPSEKKPTMQITPGKKEMMETFNENDMKIVDTLLKQGGKSRRNELERKTGISKSSLAMAINRLEKRKIIEIDRSATTHFIKLSEYFLKL